MSYEIRELDHTADVRFEVRADSLEDLYRGAALAVAELVCDPTCVRSTVTRRLHAEGPEAGSTIVFWLAELIGEAESRREVYGEVRVESCSETAVTGTVHGEKRDPSRHPFEREVKAVTWHDLEAGRDGDEWFVRIVVDI